MYITFDGSPSFCRKRWGKYKAEIPFVHPQFDRCFRTKCFQCVLQANPIC